MKVNSIKSYLDGESARLFAEGIIDTIHEPIIVLDSDLRVISVNDSFYEYFNVNPSNTIGNLIYNLGNRQWDIPVLRELLEDILPESSTIKDFEVNHKFLDIGEKTLLLNARRMDIEWRAPMILISIQDITERRKAEEALKEGEERLSSVLNNARDAIVRLNLQTGRYEYFSPATLAVYGFTPEEMLAMTSEESIKHLHPDDVQTARDGRAKAAETGEAEYDLRWQKKTGEYVWLSAYTHVTRDAAGKPLYHHSVVRDITKRKMAEESLRESKIRLLEAQRIAHLGNWEWNLQTDEVFWSPEIYAMHGISENSTALTHDILISQTYPDDLENVKTTMSRAVSEGTSFDLEYRIVRPDGKIRFIHAIGAVTKFDNEGKPILMTGTNQDITEHKKTETEIQRNLKLLDGINRVFEESLTCDSVEDVVGKCLEVAEELTGSEFSFIGEVNENGRLDDRALSPPGWEACTANPEKSLELLSDMEIVSYWGRTIKEGKTQIVNDPDSDPDRRGVPEGHPPIKSFMGVPLKQSGKAIGMIALANKKDGYTEEDKDNIETLSVAFVEAWMRKGAEERSQELMESEQQHMEELKTANTELMNIQNELKENIKKLEISNAELEQFAYVASHDLQEPLRMVASFTQLLDMKYKDKLDSEADEYIDFIVEGSHRMKDLIDDLLSFSRLNTDKKEFHLTDLNQVLDSVLLGLKSTIEEEDAHISKDNLPILWCDSSQISQVFQNLISNSIKFHQTPPRIHISSEENDHEWVLGVSDEGIGIDPEHQQKIFDVFKRLHTREEYAGTGIGLSICKRIVERHNGKIWVESEPGEGANFYFTLPKTEIDIYRK